MFIIDLLFPKFCLGCGYIGVYICPSCQDKLKSVITDNCLYCKKSSPFGLTHPYCTNRFNADGILSLYYYNPVLKKIIKNIKYRLSIEVWKEFYKIIEPETIMKLDFYKKLFSDFVIQPIPLTKSKYNQRGFNQAYLIGNFFQKILRFPMVDLLIRKNETPPQAQIKNKKNRSQNIKGAFEINNKSKDVINHVFTNVILVDDVVTSGSTVKEAAKVLKAAGAKKVFILTLAKG